MLTYFGPVALTPTGFQIILYHRYDSIYHVKLGLFIYVIKTFKGVVWAKMAKIIKFLFFAQKVSSGMGALRPKFLGG